MQNQPFSPHITEYLEKKIETYDEAIPNLMTALEVLTELFATDETIVLDDLISTIKMKRNHYQDLLNGTLEE